MLKQLALCTSLQHHYCSNQQPQPELHTGCLPPAPPPLLRPTTWYILHEKLINAAWRHGPGLKGSYSTQTESVLRFCTFDLLTCRNHRESRNERGTQIIQEKKRRKDRRIRETVRKITDNNWWLQGLRSLILAHSDKKENSILIRCHTVSLTLLTFLGSFAVTGKGTVILLVKQAMSNW